MNVGPASWLADLEAEEGVAFESLPQSEQVDLVCDVYERRWIAGQSPLIEHFLRGAPSVDGARLLKELLPLEFEYRLRSGDPPTFRELNERFPGFGLMVARFVCTDPAVANSVEMPLVRLGKLCLLEVVGHGAFGTVHRAYDPRLDRVVAVKVPNAIAEQEYESVRRFVREARNAAGLAHPGIVRVFEVGLSDEMPYIVSEFVEGETLAERQSRGERLEVRAAVDVVAQVADALDYAHREGVVHRDLKPSNILLEPKSNADGEEPGEVFRPRVLDFGLARREYVDATLTMEGQLLGTPAYMSPEQARGETRSLDRRSDIYSLGAILYELLVGRRPFEGNTHSAVLYDVVNTEPQTPCRHDRTVPRDLATICMKCLDKERDRRYASAGDLAADLRRWLQHQPVAARPISLAGRLRRRARRHPALSAASVALAVTTLTLVWLLVWANGASSRFRSAQLEEYLSAQPAKLVAALERIRQGLPQLAHRLRSTRDNRDLPPERRLRAALALWPADAIDHRLLDSVIDQQSHPAELRLLGAELASHGYEGTETLWTLAKAERARGRWLRLLACLAWLDPQQPYWSQNASEIARELSITESDQTDQWARAFFPIGEHLVEPLRRLANSGVLEDDHRLAACRALTHFLADDPGQLADLIVLADAPQHGVLVAQLRTHGTAVLELLRRQLDALRAQLREAADEPAREQAIQGAANVTLALLALGDEDAVWPGFCHAPDPRLQTYLIHWSTGRTSPEPLIRRWIELRRQGDDRGALHALTLAIGNYAPRAIGHDERARLEPLLLETYVLHADAGVHSACGWLLRKWGHTLQEIERQLVEQGIVQGRDWYYNSLGQCMVIVSHPTFVMGSPEDEPHHAQNGFEDLHECSIPRRYAIATTETSCEQFLSLLASHPYSNAVSPSPGCPMNAVQFSDAVEFCRLLSEQEGLTEQVFSVQEDGSWQADVRRLGYRLPTEAEWECACRAGTTTARFFGSHETRLPESYRGIKSDGSYEVASYMPNQWGLFDVYGNLFEWTLGKLGPLKAATDPSLFLTTHYPPGVIRGGNYRSDESIIRSAARTPMIVDNADGPLVLGIGLRIAATLQNDDTMEVLGRNP